MDTEIDWARELEQSFGTGDDVPVGHYVAAGHTAVRRRRRIAAVAGLGVAAVVGGVVWGLAPGGSPRTTDAPIANESSAAPVTGVPWSPGDPPARIGGTGFEVRDGAVVHERRDDLYPGKRTESVALDVSFGGERWWVEMEWDDRGGTGASQSVQPEDGLFDDFDAFVRDRVRGGGMIVDRTADDGQVYAGLVRWDGADVTTEKGVVLVRQVPDPVSSADESIGLELRKGDETTWMLITQDANGSSASWIKASGSGWSTFAQWLDDQVAMQSGGATPTLVALGDDGTVTPAQSGVEVLEQQADPDLQAYGTAAQGAVSAVALVEWNGTRWFVFALGGNGPDSVTPVAVDKAGGARTLDEFVAFMADKADEGGMR